MWERSVSNHYSDKKEGGSPRGSSRFKRGAIIQTNLKNNRLNEDLLFNAVSDETVNVGISPVRRRTMQLSEKDFKCCQKQIEVIAQKYNRPIFLGSKEGSLKKKKLIEGKEIDKETQNNHKRKETELESEGPDIASEHVDSDQECWESHPATNGSGGVQEEIDYGDEQYTILLDKKILQSNRFQKRSPITDIEQELWIRLIGLLKANERPEHIHDQLEERVRELRLQEKKQSKEIRFPNGNTQIDLWIDPMDVKYKSKDSDGVRRAWFKRICEEDLKSKFFAEMLSDEDHLIIEDSESELSQECIAQKIGKSQQYVSKRICQIREIMQFSGIFKPVIKSMGKEVKTKKRGIADNRERRSKATQCEIEHNIHLG